MIFKDFQKSSQKFQKSKFYKTVIWFYILFISFFYDKFFF